MNNDPGSCHGVSVDGCDYPGVGNIAENGWVPWRREMSKHIEDFRHELALVFVFNLGGSRLWRG